MYMLIRKLALSTDFMEDFFRPLPTVTCTIKAYNGVNMNISFNFVGPSGTAESITLVKRGFIYSGEIVLQHPILFYQRIWVITDTTFTGAVSIGFGLERIHSSNVGWNIFRQSPMQITSDGLNNLFGRVSGPGGNNICNLYKC